MLDKSTLDRLIGRAILAPSSHNTQPWVFELRDDRIRLHADRTRALPVNDPDDRELVISCGCALMNLRVAAAQEGLGASVVPLPDPRNEDVLAEIAFSGEAEAALARLAAAIPERRTYRKRFAGRDVPGDIVDDLKAAAVEEGAGFDPFEDEETRQAAAGLVAQGDTLLWANASWRRELAQWMHPRRSGDGLSLPWLAVPAAKFVVRSFDMGGGVAAKDSDLAENSPLLAMLGTAGDGQADWLAAGQALERVLLTATAAGLQASYLNQPVEVADLRSRLADLGGRDGVPQILLRLGYPEDDLPAAPRRPMADVVET